MSCITLERPANAGVRALGALASSGLDPRALPAALGLSALTWFALGVDFPRANARFSRLVWPW